MTPNEATAYDAMLAALDAYQRVIDPKFWPQFARHWKRAQAALVRAELAKVKP